MANLRHQAEADLSLTLEDPSQWGLPVELIDPDGVKIITNNAGEPLTGQVMYESIVINPDTGEEIVVANPVVTLRRSSLPRIPAAGEKWLVRIPVDPTDGAPLADFIFDATRAPGGSRSIGYIKLYLRRAQQN